MKTQILRFSPLQSAKVMAVLSFMMLIPPLALFALAALLVRRDAGVVIMVVLLPFLYLVLGFVLTLIGAWVYNLVAARIGGFEFGAVDAGRHDIDVH